MSKSKWFDFDFDFDINVKIKMILILTLMSKSLTFASLSFPLFVFVIIMWTLLSVLKNKLLFLNKTFTKYIKTKIISQNKN